MQKQKATKDEKRKNKEHKVIEKFVKKKPSVKQKYITKGVLKKKFKNEKNTFFRSYNTGGNAAYASGGA